jgi:uncharacterized protein YndB with AHSA1/START domain
MDKSIIEKAIAIKASPQKVWQVFTEPAVTRHMGGEYISDWKVGSMFGWKGQDGNLYTSGTILQLEAGKLLKHTLCDLNDKNVLISTITYTFRKTGEGTTLFAREELNHAITQKQLNEVSEGWDTALKAVKEIAEKI